MLDRTGKFLEIGQNVLVPSPSKSDLFKASFVGTIADILEGRGSVIVEDQCSDYFEVEAERLIVRE